MEMNLEIAYFILKTWNDNFYSNVESQLADGESLFVAEDRAWDWTTDFFEEEIEDILAEEYPGFNPNQYNYLPSAAEEFIKNNKNSG